MPGCRIPGLRSSWPRSPLGARPLSQEKRATETHFGFETVSEEEKGGKVYQVFESVAKKYDVMNDMMSLGIHRLWKDLLLWKMHPFPGTQLLDVAGGTGDIAFRFLNYVQAQHQRKQKRQLRAQQNLSWEEIAKKYQNEEDSLGGSHVMICDINREMLKIGRRKACAQGYKAGLDWVLGDAEELPFDDGCAPLIGTPSPGYFWPWRGSKKASAFATSGGGARPVLSAQHRRSRQPGARTAGRRPSSRIPAVAPPPAL